MPSPATYTRVEPVMGTDISLQIADPLPAAELERLGDEVFAWMRAVDARFSTYRPDSEVSQPVRTPSAELAEVLDRCAGLHALTDGYFDIFATGRLDPSGFVKGWAAQVASDRLAAAGCRNHCVNAGGDVRTRGHAPSGEAWRVGIRHPFEPDQVCCVVTGTDLAIATSGVYERGPHVLDPYTGAPAVGLRSVTVVGPDLGTADGLATAAVAMGGAGIDWLSTVDGYPSAVVTDDGRFLVSDAFPLADP